MFRFSLQTALDVRLRQEKIKMKELAEKLAVERKIQDAIDEINERTTHAERDMNDRKGNNCFTVEQFKFLTHFKHKMKLELADCFKRLELAHNDVVEKQNLLIQASKARKTLEIIKEKEQERTKEKIAQRERKNMDEIAGNLFIQKQRKLNRTDAI